MVFLPKSGVSAKAGVNHKRKLDYHKRELDYHKRFTPALALTPDLGKNTI